MKVFKHMTALVLALVMAAALAVTAYAATVTVKYRVYVYSDEITFRQYDYSQSTTPSITNLTILADSSLGSGSAMYHVKYVNGALAYCIEPGVHSDDSGTYKEGSSASWYNLPASVQSGIALAMSLGYPSADYKIKAMEEKGSITVHKVDVTGSPLAGAELMLETSTDGKTWTEVGRVTTDKTGVAKWSDLKVGVQYRVTETKSPAGYTLLTEPLFAGVLDSRPMIILTRTFVLDLANSAWATFSLSCSSVCRYSRSTWLTLMVGYPWIRLPIMTLSFSSACPCTAEATMGHTVETMMIMAI